MLTLEETRLLIHGTHKEFDKIMEGTGNISEHDISMLKDGDLILRNKKSFICLFYHAGIYCGNSEEVIEFSAKLQQGWTAVASCSSSDVDGGVTKAHVTNFIGEKPYIVLRLRYGIPKDFAQRVKVAMKSQKKYNLLDNNCLQFALDLLGLSTQSLPERQ
ncbi:hypothetical protein QQF64_023821 [Cirrhinus molitorella]|uniref:LRAT domain-containing protein n=1 Tax=Cirrhinus molitorella TaxID=172907 RepID=A0ABR3NKD2_9TELE